jgi:glycosyltransferase involved in cell wall biosynthesis
MPQTLRKDTPKSEPKKGSIEPVAELYPEISEEPLGPRVTAILISYNRAAALRRAIQALERSRDRERLEILVVDNGSQDESPQLDIDFPDITLMRLPHHFGATKAMNIGSRTAKAEILFFLSPCVEVEPDTVTKLADQLELEADAAAVCPLLTDAEGGTVSRNRKMPTSDTFNAACRGEELPAGPIDLTQESVAVEYPGIDALMVRKQFVKGMNYFDERYGHCWADADLAMQARNAQRKIRIYPKIRAVYRPERDPLAGEAIVKADCILGAAHFLGKYHGFMAGLGFRLVAILRALFRLDLGQISSLVSGQKLDGNQNG